MGAKSRSRFVYNSARDPKSSDKKLLLFYRDFAEKLFEHTFCIKLRRIENALERRTWRLESPLLKHDLRCLRLTSDSRYSSACDNTDKIERSLRYIFLFSTLNRLILQGFQCKALLYLKTLILSLEIFQVQDHSVQYSKLRLPGV